ncbi:unnamed protein product [Symbiodinium sp. CCMP2592]|nr:unnamed protein product [Symbiodinium sp. CCMP2592]
MSGWDTALQQSILEVAGDDAGIAGLLDPAASSEDLVLAKRKPGRPKGTKGSRIARSDAEARAAASMPDFDLDASLDRRAQQLDLPSWQSHDRSTERQLQRCEQQDLMWRVGRQFGLLPAVLQAGRPVQKTVVQALCHALDSEKQNLVDVKLSKSGKVRAAATDPVKQSEAVDRFLDGTALTCSCTSLANIHQCNSSTLQKHLLASACIVAESSSFMLGSMVETCLSAAKAQGLLPMLFALRVRYDETPTKVRLVSACDKSLQQSCGFVFVPKAASSGQALQDFGARQGLAVGESCTLAKILQTELELGMLFASPDMGDYWWVRSPIPCTLSAMDRTTGENERAAVWDQISRVPEMNRLARTFKYRMRLTCTDRYSANYRCEKGLQCEGFMPKFAKVHTPCDCHKVATSLKCGIANLEKDVSGLVNSALVMAGEAGALHKLRSLLFNVIAADLDIKKEMPPSNVLLEEYRTDMLKLYLPQESLDGTRRQRHRNREREYVLRSFLNGYINTDCDGVQHFCAPGCCEDRQETLKCIYLFVVPALLPSKLPVLCRKGWHNQCYPVDWCGLLEAHHRLFSRLLLAFVGSPHRDLQASAAAATAVAPEEALAVAGWLL